MDLKDYVRIVNPRRPGDFMLLHHRELTSEHVIFDEAVHSHAALKQAIRDKAAAEQAVADKKVADDAKKPSAKAVERVLEPASAPADAKGGKK